MQILSKSFNSNKILNDMAEKYFTAINNSVFMMRSASNGPKFNDDIWAKLIIDALTAINDGLSLDKNASIPEVNKEMLTDMIGSEAFNTISHLVTTYTMQKLIKEISNG